jgi:hypothetical protein
MTALLRGRRTVPGVEGLEESVKAEVGRRDAAKEVDPDAGKGNAAPVPAEFEYHSDGGREDE